MTIYEFQKDVIDRLARIETKQDDAASRISTLEGGVLTLKLQEAERKGDATRTSKVVAAASGLGGTVLGALLQYIWHH